MATYIQNVQDKVTQVRPPQTNWQFEAQLLSTRQAKYDAGHNKLSKMYGQILNAGLTREGNVEAREEFFQLIDNDLRKVAGVDLSLDSNVTQARAVFNQIYDNDFLVKDMVWTKNFQGEMKRAEGFKNCVDPEECGGQYWEDGVKAMNYKREEFKNSTNNESMRAQNVRYIPYNNLMAQAMVDMEAAGLDVTMEPEPNGSRYRAKMRNGSLVVTPLLSLFSGLYAKNPEFQDMYKVMAFNERKDWTYNAVQAGDYATLDEAAVGFVELKGEGIKQDFENLSRGIKYDTDALKDKFNAYKEDELNGTLLKTDVKDYERTAELLASSQELDSYLDLIKNAQKNQHSQTSMANIGDVLDGVRAATLFNGEMLNAAQTFANKDKEVTYTEDKGWLAQQQHGFNIDMENREFDHQIALEKWRLKHDHSSYRKEGVNYDKMTIKNLTAENALAEANALNTNLGVDFLADIDRLKGYDPEAQGINKDMNADEIQDWITAMSPTNAMYAGAAQSKLNDLVKAQHKAVVTSNIRQLEAINAGNNPANYRNLIDWDVMSSTDMEGVALGFPDLWKDEVPAKAVLEMTAFNEWVIDDATGLGENVPGRLYEGDQTGRYYVRDGNDQWHIHKTGDWNNKSGWETGPAIQKEAWDAWNSHQLNNTTYN